MRCYISMLVEKCWLLGCLLSPQSFPLTESCRKIPLPFNSIEFPLPGDRKTVGKFHWWPMRVEIFNPHCRNSSEYLALPVKKFFRPPDTWVLRHPVRLADFSVNYFYSVEDSIWTHATITHHVLKSYMASLASNLFYPCRSSDTLCESLEKSSWGGSQAFQISYKDSIGWTKNHISCFSPGYIRTAEEGRKPPVFSSKNSD